MFRLEGRVDDQQPKSEPEKAIEIAPGETTETPPPSDNLSRQFEALGRQFAATAQAAWNSDQRHAMQKDLINGVQAMRDHLDAVLEQLRSDGRTSGVMDQADDVADSIRENVPVEDVRKNITHMADFLAGKMREAEERFERHDDEPKKD